MNVLLTHKRLRNTLTSENIFEKFRRGLIVSCQAEEGSPFNNPEDVAKFAIAAVDGGAVGIRSAGIGKTKRIIESVNVPVIGLTKSYFNDGLVCITRSMEDVKSLIEIGTDIIAIDGTDRLMDGLSGAEFIAKVKKETSCIVMADISTVDEAKLCIEAGVDCISTALHGYTPETIHEKESGCNLELLNKVVAISPIPVIAEGRYNTPTDAGNAIKSGAWAVVVGTAITRPHVITSWFVKEIRNANNK